jgi:hypothetical protein
LTGTFIPEILGHLVDLRDHLAYIHAHRRQRRRKGRASAGLPAFDYNIYRFHPDTSSNIPEPEPRVVFRRQY